MRRLITYLSISADIISFLGAASISCCQEFVDPGITKPKLKNHSRSEVFWGARARFCYIESREYVVYQNIRSGSLRVESRKFEIFIMEGKLVFYLPCIVLENKLSVQS